MTEFYFAYPKSGQVATMLSMRPQDYSNHRGYFYCREKKMTALRPTSKKPATSLVIELPPKNMAITIWQESGFTGQIQPF